MNAMVRSSMSFTVVNLSNDIAYDIHEEHVMLIFLCKCFHILALEGSSTSSC